MEKKNIWKKMEIRTFKKNHISEKKTIMLISRLERSR